MKNEIIILCNSPQCLNEISSGNWPNLNTKNIFTCNLAYNYFRTAGRHLNIFADTTPILDFLSNKNWLNIYGCLNYSHIEHIFNVWDLNQNKIQPVAGPDFKSTFKTSPVEVPASSAISALFYLSAVENFDKIHLVGYTINEWEGIENVKELQSKKNAFDEVHKKYEETNPRECVYEFSRK